MIWICRLCDKEEHVHRCTDETLFVLHHCRCFGGAVAVQSKNVRRYVAEMPGFFQNDPHVGDPINIVVFPLREAA